MSPSRMAERVSARTGVPKPAVILAALLALIQYPLWLGKGGLLKVWEMERQLEAQRVDNAKLLRYADALAYEKVKEFDFPHKRAALMHCWRDPFFERVLR